MNTTVTIVMVKRQKHHGTSTAPYGFLDNQIPVLPQHNLYTNHYYQQAIITHMITNKHGRFLVEV